MHFNPRPPRGGRQTDNKGKAKTKNISIHAPREGGDNIAKNGSNNRLISIHAPREGGDLTREYHQKMQDNISIHAPREGGDSKDAQFYL